MKAIKTRVAYARHIETGEMVALCDTIDEALKANMMVRDFEKRLIELNPQLEITFKVEERP